MTNRLKHILVLPRWYPNKTDIQLGIFIQRQLILLQNDFEFTVIYVQPVADQSTKFLQVTNRPAPGFTERIIYYRSAKGPFRKITNFIRFNRAQRVGILKVDKKIDAFHIQVPYRTALPALRSYLKNKTPYFITEHWSGHLNGAYKNKNWIDRFLYVAILRRALKVSTVSKTLNEAFKSNTGIDSIHIPNLIEKATVLTETSKEEQKLIQILSVGDFSDETKNQSGLIHAFSVALVKNPNLKLTLIGGGPDEERIKNLANSLKINAKNLSFLGRQTHNFVLNAMHECDFYICNSRYETFGMTIAEALICGKPVISTRCGGPEEYLDKKNSLLIAPAKKFERKNSFELYLNNSQTAEENAELSQAILRMAETYKNYDPELIQKSIEEKYGTETIREKWIQFFDH